MAAGGDVGLQLAQVICLAVTQEDGPNHQLAISVSPHSRSGSRHAHQLSPWFRAAALLFPGLSLTPRLQVRSNGASADDLQRDPLSRPSPEDNERWRSAMDVQGLVQDWKLYQH